MASSVYSREDFIEEMIKELSSQQSLTTTDKSSLSFKDRNSRTDIEIYTKLCYDFPLITDNELNQLSQSLHEILTTSTLTTTNTNLINLIDSFVISDIFLDNIKYLCDVSNSKITESTATSSTDIERKNMSQYKLAMLIYFQLPYYILNLNIMQLCKLFCIEMAHFEWWTVLQRYCDVVENSSVTVLTGLTSKDLQDCFPYLTSLTTCINIIGSIVNTLENNTAAIDYDDTLTVDIICLEKFDFPQANTILTFLPELSKSSNKIAILNILKILKKCWLHMVFLYRDLLTQFPGLYVSHLASFLTSIHMLSNCHYHCHFPHHTSTNITTLIHPQRECGQITPSACLLVMTISNLANSMHCKSRDTAEENSIKQAERCLLAYLSNENDAMRLSLYVEICNQMALEDASIIPFETISLLLDIGMLYVSNSDSKYGNVQQYLSVTPRSGTNQAIEVLFTSRLLPSLFLNFLKILNKQKKDDDSQTTTRNIEVQNHVFLRYVWVRVIIILISTLIC